MGAFDHSGSSSGSPDGPVITVNGVAIMGGVEVKRKPTAQAARDARQLRQEARREEVQARRQYHRERHEAHHHHRHGELD
jgi:hypothetical protein